MTGVCYYDVDQLNACRVSYPFTNSDEHPKYKTVNTLANDQSRFNKTVPQDVIFHAK